VRLRLLTASTDRELEMAFDTMAQQYGWRAEAQRLLYPGALLVGVDPWFRSRRKQIVALAAHYAVPAGYECRDYAGAGGLMSYGPDDNDRERKIGLYIARILKGAKPADLPVQQATKFEFILNFKTAKEGLGITYRCRCARSPTS